MNDTRTASEPERGADEDQSPREIPDESGDSVDEHPGQAGHPREFGGRKGPDPVRYGDWEKNGRCIDF